MGCHFLSPSSLDCSYLLSYQSVLSGGGAYMFIYVCLCVCTHVWRPEVGIRCLPLSLYPLLNLGDGGGRRQGLSLDSNLPRLVRPRLPSEPWDRPISTPPITLRLPGMCCHARLSPGCPGSELSSSCSCSRRFTHWATSPGQTHPFVAIFLNSNFRTVHTHLIQYTHLGSAA